MASVGNDALANHSGITLGFLRNGPPADVARSARESALEPKYYSRSPGYDADWEGDVAAREPPMPHFILLDCEVRNAFAQLVETHVAEVGAAATAAVAAGGPPRDDDAARAAAVADGKIRIEAIGVGSARAGGIIAFRILATEYRATEREAVVLRPAAPAAAADGPAYTRLMRRATRGWTIVVDSGNDPAGLTEIEDVALNMAALTVPEAELAFAIAVIGQVSPVRAGAQLFLDGHHYHSDANSSARHRAIEKEVMGTMTQAAKDIWRANTDTLRNAMWHAAFHCVDGTLLQTLGEDPLMPERLDATGIGSMSVGLPAQEDLFNRAGSYTTCLTHVRQTIARAGHRVTMDDLEAAVTALRGLPRRGPLPAQRPALPGKPEAAWPGGVDTRAKALKQFLVPYLDNAEPVAAWCFGYYQQLAADAGIRRSSREGSLLRSHSLLKAQSNHLGESNLAATMYAQRKKYIKEQAEDGVMETYTGAA